MVVWLDELQRYLDGEHGLTGAVVRVLLNAPGPVVLIGTLWPDRYAVPGPGGADPRAGTVRPAEQGRVRADPDPGGRAAAGRPLAGRPDRRRLTMGERGAALELARRACGGYDGFIWDHHDGSMWPHLAAS